MKCCNFLRSGRADGADMCKRGHTIGIGQAEIDSTMPQKHTLFAFGILGVRGQVDQERALCLARLLHHAYKSICM